MTNRFYEEALIKKEYLKTYKWLLTLITGGVILNNRLFSVKSDIRSVADIIISFKGLFLLLRNGTIRDKNPISMSV